jgi:hypothetical protein
MKADDLNTECPTCEEDGSWSYDTATASVYSCENTKCRVVDFVPGVISETEEDQD